MLDDTFDSLAGNRPASEILRGALGPDDIARIGKAYTPEIIAAAEKEVLDSIADNTGMYGIREGLKRVRDFARKAVPQKLANHTLAEAMHDIAGTVRANLDDLVVKTATESGAYIPPTFKRDWGFLQPLEKGALKADWTPIANNLGSNTFAKMATAGMVGGLMGSPDEDIGTILSRMAIGSLVGAGAQKLTGAAGIKALSGLAGLARKLPGLANKIAANPNAAATVGGGLASLFANGKPPEGIETPGQIPIDETGNASQEPQGLIESDPVNMQRIDEGIQREFIKQTNGFYGAPDESNPTFTEFRDTVLWALKDQGESPAINPKLAANVMFSDPKQREKFLAAIDADQRIRSNWEGAAPTFGTPVLGSIGGAVQGFLKPEAQAAKASLMTAIKDATGGDKAMENAINTILTRRGSEKEKFDKIMAIIRKAQPVGARALELGRGTP